MNGSPPLWRSIRRLSIVALIAALCFPAIAVRADDGQMNMAKQGRELPRRVLGLFDSRREPNPEESRIHRLLDMPLNHLGLVVDYHDIAKGLPDPASLTGLRGVVTFFDSAVPDSRTYLEWASAVLDRNIRYVVMGDPGLVVDGDRIGIPLDSLNNFLGRLGLRAENRYVPNSYRVRALHKTPGMIEFERPLNGPLPGYDVIRAIDPAVKVHLTMQDGDNADTRSDLVTVGPRGGRIASGYDLYSDPDSNRTLWWLNPFEYLRAAFAGDELPAPDTTTIVGRRIYYSHIDGDGWHDLAENHELTDDRRKASEMILAKAVIPYPDLPVTVAPVVADLHPDWSGDERGREIARDFFLLPQVEAGSHTWSHPFDWRFFENHDGEAERAYAARPLARLERGYPASRGFRKQPFSLDREIGGSVAYIDSLLPPGKRTRIVQWSGDASPYEAALAAAGQASVTNINGPESRLDEEFPSYSQVPAIGVQVGAHRQIYASAGSENIYTDIWSHHFFGFRHLDRTVARTETPYRIKPFNIHYHMYSGSKAAGLNAVVANLTLARASRIAPVSASDFAGIAQGFYTARLYDLGDRRWRIENRGNLQTIRFDRATFSAVDFKRSRGVLGQNHYQGSLYVALDPAEVAPIIALHDVEDPGREESAGQPYVIDSRWLISGLVTSDDGWTFTAQGFGAGEMVWQASPGSYTVRIEPMAADSTANAGGTSVPIPAAPVQATPAAIVAAGEMGIVSFTVDAVAITPVKIRIDREKGS
jgi:polysaccharide biosynthesis protein PelA